MIEPTSMLPAGARVLFYCHDTYGLGHLRRTLTLAHHFHAAIPGISQLVVTGSPSASRFTYPGATDFIKLPSVTKNAFGEYEARSISSEIDTVSHMRADILLSAARHFRPDVFVVDHAPAGMRGEVRSTLEYLKRECPDTRLVVGLRDILDEAEVVRASWEREGIHELFDDVYDDILVYGNREFYDVVEEYGLSPRAAAKTRFVGYLGRDPGSRSPDEVRASLEMKTDTLVVVTAGGGGDGKTLYEAMLRDLHSSGGAGFDCLIVGGPLQARADQARLRNRLGRRNAVHFLDFTDDMLSYVGAADAVISMGGYNAVCEILSLRRPALIVPRVKPRQEQLIRASVLSGHNITTMLHPDQLTPGNLIHAAHELLAQPAGARAVLSMDGLGNVVDAIARFVDRPARVDASAGVPIHASA